MLLPCSPCCAFLLLLTLFSELLQEEGKRRLVQELVRLIQITSMKGDKNPGAELGKSEDKKAPVKPVGYSRDFRQSKWHYSISPVCIRMVLGAIRQAEEGHAALSHP